MSWSVASYRTQPQAFGQNVMKTERIGRTADPGSEVLFTGYLRAQTICRNPFQIFQSPNNVEFVYQFASANRNVLMEDPGPATSRFLRWVNRWPAGRAIPLSSRSPSQNDQTWFDRAGNHHSARNEGDRAIYADGSQSPSVRGRYR